MNQAPVKPPRLTIVVPTFERQRFIDRQVMHWSGGEVRLVVLDGSAKPWEPAPALTDLRHVSYVHMPGASIESRLRYSEQCVRTPYVAMLSDDEFFLHSAVEQCIQFLDGQPLYSSCKGLSVAFNIRDGILEMRAVYPKLRGYAIEAPNAAVRMTEHMKRYAMASLWSVQRLDVYQACVRGLGQPAFASAAASEISISLTNAILGRIAVLDTLMWLRSAENPNIWWNAGRKSFHEWFQGTSAPERNRFIGLIRDSVVNIGPENLSSEDVESAILSYCFTQKLTRRKRAIRQLNRLKIKLRKLALSSLPKGLASWLRGTLQRGKIWQTPTAILQELTTSGVTVYPAELLALQGLIDDWESLYD